MQDLIYPQGKLQVSDDLPKIAKDAQAIDQIGWERAKAEILRGIQKMEEILGIMMEGENDI